MTNLEALKAQSAIAGKVPVQVLTFQLFNKGLAADDDYKLEDARKLELAYADTLLYVSTQPASIKELDWGITNIDVSDLIKLRSGILSKWGVADEFSSKPTIKGRRPW